MGRLPPVSDDGPLGHRQRADEGGVRDIGEGAHHVLLLDETEDVARSDPEEFTTTERAQRPHRCLGILMTRNGRLGFGHECLTAAWQEFAIIGQQSHGVG